MIAEFKQNLNDCENERSSATFGAPDNFLSRFRQQTIYLASTWGPHLKKYKMEINCKHHRNDLQREDPWALAGRNNF